MKYCEPFRKRKEKDVKKRHIRTSKIGKLSRDTMIEFNSRIKMFIKCMDETMYTDTLLKKAYLDLISEVDNNIWWNLAQTSHDKTMGELMKMATTLDELKTYVRNRFYMKQPDQLQDLQCTLLTS
ncbi:hypothetical protein AYI69_g7318 [Smittium culicis]|uniref:Uncharacterized protein n=1 Tax=Smittium culicis TaxID=133412 RepID=A0A1R1XT09_9FUNG|nr:hypothetical protein AYI69_g9323 [Smittium culicis]OMJ17746.1 hypothetical protein AYI69_g7318 [Smittium culicis]